MDLPGDAVVAYELRMTHTAFCARHADLDCRVVVDCGAARGSFALPALQAWPAARLLAVEPSLAELCRLRATAIQAGVEHRMLILAAAVWSQAGEIRPFGHWERAGNFGQTGLVFADPMRFVGQTTTVTLAQVFALAAQFEEEIDFLKLDIEGSEHVVLPATPREVLRRCRWLHIDGHNVDDKAYFGAPWTAIDVPAYLRAAGFELVEPMNFWRRDGAP